MAVSAASLHPTLKGTVKYIQGTPGQLVTIERRIAGSSTFRALKTLPIDAGGFFTTTTTVNVKSSFRFRYTDAAARTVTSTTYTVAPPSKKQ